MKKLSLLIISIIAFMQFGITTSFAGGDEYEISLGEPYSMVIGESGEIVKFSPDSDGWYKFYTTGDYDTWATLYNYNMDEIKSEDDTNYGLNFCMKEYLYEGYTYFLEVGAFYIEDPDLASFDLIVENAIAAESVEITKAPFNQTVIEGFESQTLSCEGLEAEFTLSDGTKVPWSYLEDGPVGDSYVSIYVDDDGSGHYYIDIICDDAYARIFYDTVSGDKSVVLSHYLKDGYSVASTYIAQAGTYDVLFVDYDGDKYNKIIVAELTTSGAGVYDVYSEEIKLESGDKIILTKDVDTLSPECEAYIVR